MSEILLDDEFIAIPLNVGRALGSFDEAVFLQFIHRWCLNAAKHKRKHNFKEGSYWTYMTYNEIVDQLPMFSLSKVKRLIKSLREKGFLIVGNFNRFGYDKTNWYRVDYEELDKLKSLSSKWTNGEVQDELVGKSNLEQPIPKSTTKSSNKINNIYTTLSSGGHFFYIYSIVYQRYMNQSHPDVTQELLDTLRYNLDTTIERLDVVEEDLSELIEYHFQNLSKNNNGHIQALLSNATDSPLYRYYNEIYNC